MNCASPLFLSEDNTKCMDPRSTDINGNPVPSTEPPSCGSAEKEIQDDGTLICVSYETVQPTILDCPEGELQGDVCVTLTIRGNR